ncbi:peptidyl-prolyl cis-trans isomerase [Sulfurimonas sp.]|jgi:parvulin-like peptidyl-prolyl isomerase|uniref:peptidylprolyl isomerase n=1 Tax=Sulfurimonas sp. TaxID=2022749 RepID=UPI0025D6C15C|nr:peptidyl-prolyl cis-trans isomerase [Sulfurimonas sp.]MBT5933875.1 peptidylprolyl isomerase [Sulfurimonas sp.]
MNTATKLLSTLLLSGIALSATTLVTVNGKAITQSEVDNELMNATQGRLNEVPANRINELRQQVLQQLVGKELIYGDAKNTGILKTKEYEAEYKKQEERMKKELAVQVWQKKQLNSIKISDKDLKSYYDKNKEEFNQKETLHARHILVKTEDEAKNIIAQIKPLSGEKLMSKFIELAKEKSTGPSGPKGGDLGYFADGQMVPAFNKKVFSMKVGTATLSPVETNFGFHVIYLEDKKAAATRTYKEVKAFIEQRLKMEKFKSYMKDVMKKLHEKATIK